MKNSRVGARPPAHAPDEAESLGPALGDEVRTKIGRQLRAMYDDVVRQGVPDRFVDLLNRLDERPETEHD
jgi:hypothetical protein